MLTLCIFPNFKGTKTQIAKALLLCLSIDSLLVILSLNF